MGTQFSENKNNGGKLLMQPPVGEEDTGHAPQVMDWHIHTESNAFYLKIEVCPLAIYHGLCVQTLMQLLK